MAEHGSVVLGCDINSGQDSAFQNAVAEKLEGAGYSVEKLAIAPNPFASYSYSSKAQGKYGVYLMADSIVSIADYSGATGGANKNGNSFKMAVFGIRTDVIPKLRGDGFSKYPIGPDGDCTSVCNKIAHKTYPEIEKICKQDVRITSGSTPEEMANNVLKALGGKTSEDGDSSASTIKDAIKEVASFWDGEVEIKVELDKVKLRKIPEPEKDHLENNIVEGVNVQLNSISIQDYHPDTINTLKVHWPGGEDIVLTDEALIARFGEKAKEMDAVKRVVKEGEETPSSTTTAVTDTTNTDDTTTGTETAEEESTSVSSTTYEEVPVQTYEEALSFANSEWAKIRRNNGHEVELKVIGDYQYKPGWVHVKLYSYPTDMWMYIKSSNHEISENGEFNSNLILVDYPPSLGEWNESDSDDEETEEDEETTEEEEVT